MDLKLLIIYIILGLIAYIIGTRYKKGVDNIVNGKNKNKKITIKQWILIVLFTLTIMLIFGFGIRIGCQTGNNKILFLTGLFEILIHFVNTSLVFAGHLTPSFLELSTFSNCY